MGQTWLIYISTNKSVSLKNDNFFQKEGFGYKGHLFLLNVLVYDKKRKGLTSPEMQVV